MDLNLIFAIIYVGLFVAGLVGFIAKLFRKITYSWLVVLSPWFALIVIFLLVGVVIVETSA